MLHHTTCVMVTRSRFVFSRVFFFSSSCRAQSRRSLAFPGQHQIGLEEVGLRVGRRSLKSAQKEKTGQRVETRRHANLIMSRENIRAIAPPQKLLRAANPTRIRPERREYLRRNDNRKQELLRSSFIPAHISFGNRVTLREKISEK